MAVFERAEVAAAPVYDARAAARRRAPRRPGARSCPSTTPTSDRCACRRPVAAAERDARADRPPRPGARRRQRRRLRRPARPRPPTGSPPCGRQRRHLTDPTTTEADRARTPGPTIGAGHAGQQREDVREGARVRAPTSCSSTSRTPARPSAKESARAIAVDRAHRPGLGPHGARRPGQRPRHAVVPRRHHRGRHRRPRRARRAHRPEGPLGPRRLVGRRPAHPARDQARPDEAHRARGAHRGGRGPGQRGRDRPGRATASRPSSSAPATCRPRCTPGSTATSTRSSEYPGDFWHFARVRSLTAARGAGIDAIDAPVPRLPGPRRLPARRRRTPACSASTASGPSTRARSPIANEVFAPDRRGDRRRRASRSRSTAARRPTASAPSAGTAGSSTPPTCAWPRTCCTRPPSRRTTRCLRPVGG